MRRERLGGENDSYPRVDHNAKTYHNGPVHPHLCVLAHTYRYGKAAVMSHWFWKDCMLYA